MTNKLNLIWRIIGGNAILMFLGFILLKVNNENAMYLIITNLLVVLIISVRVIKNKLTDDSNMKHIVGVYVICRLVIDFSYTKSNNELILALLSTLVGAVWIIHFILPQKINQ